MTGRVERRLPPAATPGYWRRHVHKESARNPGSPKAWSAMTNRKPAKDRLGALGWRRGSQYRGSRVTPVEGRDLSSRQTQQVVRDLGDWVTYQFRKLFRNCGRRCTRKRRQKPAIASTHCTTRSAGRTFWPIRLPSAAPTRAHRGE